MEYRTREFTLLVSGLDCVVRESDGNAEQRLFDNIEELHKALPDYWAYCTLKLGDNEKVTRRHILKLLAPDQVQLAIEIFRTGTIDDEMVLTRYCTKCKRDESYALDFKKMDLMPIPDGKTGPDPTFEITLPVSGIQIVFGYLTGIQELEELDTPGFNPSRQAFKAIRSIDGKTDITLKDVLAVPTVDQKVLREAIREKRCGYDPRVRFGDNCGNRAVINLLTDPTFLAPGLPRPDN